MNNSEAINYILNSFNENKNSHAFLVVTNNIQNAIDDIKELLKKINCKQDKHNDCNCNCCQTIESDSNPDVMFVYPDGKEIKKDQVLNIIKNFSTKPLISKFSSYIIVNADRLNDAAANKMLKFLEEPEGSIIGFYITDRLPAILPTIRSRCEIYNFNYEKKNILDILEISELEYSQNYEYCLNLLEKLNNAPKYVLMLESKIIGKKERQEIEVILKLLRQFYILKYRDLLNNNNMVNEAVDRIVGTIYTNDIKIIVKRIKLLDNILDEFKINVNKELIFNKLFLKWE